MNALIGQLVIAATLAVGVYVVLTRVSFKKPEPKIGQENNSND